MKAATRSKPKHISPRKPREKSHAKNGAPVFGAEPGSSYDFIMALIERTDKIPAEVWDGLPDDGSKQVDHYLYGSQKVSD